MRILCINYKTLKFRLEFTRHSAIVYQNNSYVFVRSHTQNHARRCTVVYSCAGLKKHASHRTTTVRIYYTSEKDSSRRDQNYSHQFVFTTTTARAHNNNILSAHNRTACSRRDLDVTGCDARRRVPSSFSRITPVGN